MKSIPTYPSLLLLLLIFIWRSTLISAQQPGAPEAKGIQMDAATFTEAIDHRKDVFVFDLRDLASYQAGHLRRAVSLTGSASSIAKTLRNQSKESVLFIYCSNGALSKQVADILMSEGYTEVTYMVGGFEEWKKLGLTNYE
ncbi:MAG: rhodanese-like domain-containing protein [Cytophagaceae bacterium]|jgi:rhodanese-related sulfurtransferase|nr:rhodanese-like domain-containing protein [Cytophagaceae bacterium]